MKKQRTTKLLRVILGNRKRNRAISPESGFSYIDVMIGIVILFVAILQMASALSANLLRSYAAEKKVIAKQIGLSTIESIISARDIRRVEGIAGWDNIGNVGTNPVNGVPQGIFLNGWCPIREDFGFDGAAGTADDACPGYTICVVNGQPPNTSPVIQGFERKIEITDLQDEERPTPPNPISRRRIDVKVRYFINSYVTEETLTTILTNY